MTARSDEKTQRSPAGDRIRVRASDQQSEDPGSTPGGAALRFLSDPAVSSSIFVGEMGREFD